FVVSLDIMIGEIEDGPEEEEDHIKRRLSQYRGWIQCGQRIEQSSQHQIDGDANKVQNNAHQKDGNKNQWKQLGDRKVQPLIPVKKRAKQMCYQQTQQRFRQQEHCSLNG